MPPDLSGATLSGLGLERKGACVVRHILGVATGLASSITMGLGPHYGNGHLLFLHITSSVRHFGLDLSNLCYHAASPNNFIVHWHPSFLNAFCHCIF